MKVSIKRQTFGDTACHPERSEGSGSTGGEILRGVYPERSEGLRMTARTPLKSAHGKSYLQTSDQTAVILLISQDIDKIIGGTVRDNFTVTSPPASPRSVGADHRGGPAAVRGGVRRRRRGYDAGVARSVQGHPVVSL